MRCNHDQCPHHDGYERCARPEKVVISSIGQCLLQFEPATVSIRKDYPKPTPQAVMDWLISVGGESSIRLMSRKFRGFGSRSEDAWKFAADMQKNGSGVEIVVVPGDNGRPKTKIRLKGEAPVAPPEPARIVESPAVDKPKPSKPAPDKQAKDPDKAPDKDDGDFGVPRSDVIAFITKMGGHATSQAIRHRFKTLRRAGGAFDVLQSLVIDKLGHWYQPPRRCANQALAPIFVLNGFDEPGPDHSESVDDDMSPIKEKWDPDNPLAEPTKLLPGTEEKIKLMRRRVEANLPCVVTGDRYGYDDDEYRG